MRALFRRLFGTATIALVLSAPAAAEIGGDPVRGAQLYEFKGCFACHGESGVSERTDVPHLAGQQRTYLFNQVVNFRTARANARLGYKVSERAHPTMNAQAATLRDSDIADIVTYLNGLPCATTIGEQAPPRPPVAQKCEFCHGTQGNSPFAAIPIITGQREGYIASQLRAFRQSAQHFEEDNVRTHRLVLAAAMDLTDANIAEVSKYYAQLSCR